MTRACVFAAVLAASACNNDNTVTASTGTAACVVATACGILATGVSQCTGDVLSVNNPLFAGSVSFTTKMVNCVAAAGANCDNARKCMNDGKTPVACTGTSQSCTGTVLNSCQDIGSGGNVTTALDCGDLAEMCVVNSAGNQAACGEGTCAGGAATCVGSKVQGCVNGITEQGDCADYTSTCVVGALGNAHCRGSGAACQSSLIGSDAIGNPIRCDGSVLVRCADSQESKYDCASQHQKCFANVNGAAFGCALGTDCNPTTFSATCSGNKLTYCDDGVIATFNCSSIGFKGCSPDGGGKCSS